MPRSDAGNPARLVAHDPSWSLIAQEELAAVAHALEDVEGGSEAVLDHIGSTSVPGLAAKPFVDLQVRIAPLPAEGALDAAFARIGYRRAHGSRPDSPGVYRDLPRGSEVVADEVWEKRLFVGRDGMTILHVRRMDSPWGRYAVWFRDWLRAHPDQRDRYEQVKRGLSEENHGKADYDDYTRGKTAFFDEVQASFEAWGRARP
ncbi:GrpB family protein [Microbacterium barkeri]|uniref:GrpB family protein n=1 Tax=Microbacterium barkeri TaxID=33917 RepID=UPI0024AFC203|nr:GrpB family protein [Microbacterium barkeri]MDI6943151.1 GrpB family protein [Microbacterium barkeri]